VIEMGGEKRARQIAGREEGIRVFGSDLERLGDQHIDSNYLYHY